MRNTIIAVSMALKRTFSVSESGGRASKKAKMYKKSYSRRSKDFVSVRTRRPELKYNFYPIAAQQQNSLGGVILLNGITQGVDSSGNRIGRRIIMQNVRAHGYVLPGTGDSVCTMALVLDRQADQAAPAYTDIYDVVTAVGNGIIPNPDNTNRFKILRTEDFVTLGTAVGTSSPGGDAQVGKYCLIDMFYKFQGGEEVEFTGTGGTVTSIGAGALYLVYTNSLAIGANCPYMNIAAITKYTDN